MTTEADDLDHAANMTLEATNREIRRLRAEAEKVDTSNQSGLCWFCDAETGNGRRWCDTGCRDDWEKDQ